jgi:O-antigen/teichoic acid export membrane protein
VPLIGGDEQGSGAGRRLRAFAGRVSAGWIALRILAQGSEFGAWILLAHRLPIHTLGELAIAYLVCRYAGLIGDLASPFAGVRAVARRDPPPDIAALVVMRERLSAALVLLTGAGLLLIAPRLAPLALVVLFRGSDRDWIALGNGRQLRAGVPPALAAGSLVVAAVACDTPLAIALVIGVGHVVAVALSRWLNRGIAAPSDLRAAVARVAPMTVVVVSDQFYQSSDVLLVGALIGTSSAGIYSTLYRFPAAWLAIVGLLTSGWLRTATERSLSSDGHAANVRLALSSVRVALASVVLLAPAVWFGLPLLLGSPFDHHRVTALILVAAAVTGSAAAPMATVYFTAHSDAALARVNLVIAAVNVGGGLVLIPWLGINGAAIMTLLAYLGIATFYFTRLTRQTGVPAGQPLREPDPPGRSIGTPDGP